MTEVPVFADGGYRFIKAVFQYSGGVAAEPGFAIERVRLSPAPPLARGFAVAEAHLKSLGRPLAAFCACELRSPAPFTEDGFRAFNEAYAAVLARWNVIRGGVNPVARTNVCPEHDPPQVPSMHAFSYTVPLAGAPASFIVAGGGEVPEGRANYRDHIVRPGDTSREGLRAKLRYVVAAMAERLGALGFGWPDALATQAYTVHDIGALIAEEIVAKGAAGAGLTWHYCRPPIVGLDYEMDVRAPLVERVIYV